MSVSLLERVLDRYGGTAVVFYSEEDTEGVNVRAFVQPILSKSREEQDDIRSPLGRIDPGRYLYLGGLEADLRTVSTGMVFWREQAFDVERAELILAGEEPSHYWAVLRPRREEP